MTTLAHNISAADTVLPLDGPISVASDLPWRFTLDSEVVYVTAFGGRLASAQRGGDDTTAVAHGKGTALVSAPIPTSASGGAQTPWASDIDAAGHPLHNLPDPSSAQDAATQHSTATEVTDGTVDVNGVTQIEYLFTAGGQRTQRVNVTSAQILAGFSSPPVMVSGIPGKTHLQLWATAYLNAGATPFDEPGGSLILIHDGAVPGDIYHLETSAEAYAGASDAFSILLPTPTIADGAAPFDPAIMRGKDLVLMIEQADPTMGDGSIDLTFSYVTIDTP